jgi:hypothetical protein
MSPRKQSFSPPPLTPETRYTFEDIQKMFSLTKQILEDSPLIKWSIIAAGVGGIAEASHVIWLAYVHLR